MAKKANNEKANNEKAQEVVMDKNNDNPAVIAYDSDVSNDSYMMKKCAIIGKNVRYQRKKRKFNIDNLAECIELSASYVGLLERGDRCPSIKSLLKLCDLFNVTPDELLLDKSEKNNGLVSVAESTEKNNYDAVISLLHGLTEEELEYVATLLKALRKMSKRTDSDSVAPVTYR